MQTVKEILKILVSPSGAVITVIVALIVFRKPLMRLIYRFTESEQAKAKVGRDGLVLEIGKPAEQAEKAEPKAEEPEDEGVKEVEQRLTEQEVRPLLSRVFELLYTENDYKEAQKVFHEEVELKLSEDEKLFWHAVVLRESHKAGDASAFEKLEKMVNDNETNPQLIKQLALRYRDMEEFEKAREKFLLAKDNLDINDESKRDLIVDCYIESSWCLANDDKYKDAIDTLMKILEKSEFKNQRAKILSAMANIAKDKEEVNDFICYAEASLNTDSLNTDIRFKLAYAYSNMGYEKLALLHYKKLLDISTNIMALNNIGVCYGNLKLKGKSINSYRRSAEENETLAMSNLAYCYLDAGFVNNAKELIDKANRLFAEGIEVNPRVGLALQKIEDLQKEENKTESKLLEEAKRERKFWLKYSEAKLSEKTISNKDWQGPWHTPWGAAEIAPDEESESFKIELHTKVENKIATALMPSYGLLQKNKVYDERYITIEGRISGLIGRYKIQIDNTQKTTILTAGKIYSATGYMIINESCDRIEIMEKTLDDKTEFKEWKKVGGDESAKSEVKTS